MGRNKKINWDEEIDKCKKSVYYFIKNYTNVKIPKGMNESEYNKKAHKLLITQKIIKIGKHRVKFIKK